MAPPNGLIELLNMISAEEEGELLREIYNESWDTSLSRRVQHYGHRYHYAYVTNATNATKSDEMPSVKPVKPVPTWANALFEKCVAEAGGGISCDNMQDLQVIVNEYTPGQGIRAHVDDPKQFGEWVITVSLGSACQMDFAPRRGTTKEGHSTVSIFLPRCSAYIMTGESRFQWTHSIAARKSDVIDGKRVARGTRVSVTFRSMKH